MKRKICTKCKENKSTKDYYKVRKTSKLYRSHCKKCCQSYSKEETKKEYYEKNKEKVQQYKKEHYLKNKEKALNRAKKYYEDNKEYVKATKKEWNKIYYQKNKKRLSDYQKNYAIKNKDNKNFSLNRSMSRAIRDSLKTGKLGISWIDLVDYTVDELMSHLESKFEYGMNWSNYGKCGWHIDHIVPKSLFEFDSYNHPAFKSCWSLKNLQPLWSTRDIAIKHGAPRDYIGNTEKRNIIEITEEVKKILIG
mgnify:CR=1 FL=1